MSLGIYPVFNPKVPEAQFRVLGEVLASECTTLHEIAEANSIASITSFGDNREIPSDFEGSPDDFDAMLGPFDEWFEPAEAIDAFAALIDVIRTSPYESRNLDDPESVIEELAELIRVLTIAERNRSRFHLDMR